MKNFLREQGDEASVGSSETARWSGSIAKHKKEHDVWTKNK